MRLIIQMPASWSQHENPQGPATYCRHESTSALQVSWSEYRGQRALRKLSAGELKQMATKFGREKGFGEELVESSGGPCTFGSFGTAVFRSGSHPRMQVWIITDGRDYILATHICSDGPDPVEVQETQ